ncbi:MAG: hypothetical protein ABJC09_07215 [Terriglobia bacterium]
MNPAVVIAAMALFLSVVLSVFVWRGRAACVREAAQIREEFEAREADGAAQMDVLKRHVENLDTSMRNSDEILRDDRLNHSSRARALQLLRAGIAPDSAALTLGMPRLELRLLGKVSRALTVSRR